MSSLNLFIDFCRHIDRIFSKPNELKSLRIPSVPKSNQIRMAPNSDSVSWFFLWLHQSFRSMCCRNSFVFMFLSWNTFDPGSMIIAKPMRGKFSIITWVRGTCIPLKQMYVHALVKFEDCCLRLFSLYEVGNFLAMSFPPEYRFRITKIGYFYNLTSSTARINCPKKSILPMTLTH